MSHEATALTSWARAIRKALLARGVDASALFAKAGLDERLMDDPNARYPVEGTRRLWELAVQATGDSAFGLTVASHVNQTTFHALGYSLLASTTLRDMFERMVRYFRIVTDAAELAFECEGDACRFEILVDPVGPQPAHEAIDAFMSIHVRTCRALHSRALAPLSVDLCRPAPADVEGFARVFRAPLTFSAPHNRLIWARAPFDEPLETANPDLARHNDEIILQYLAKLQREKLSNRVHAALVNQLPRGEPSQEAIAESLHMSLRNLQRRLREEGASYTEILNRTRQDLALSYMRGGQHSISEMTYLLGFADTSSFSRAFRRWTGTSPRQFRDQAGQTPTD